jgi:hypothetical protein
MEEMKNREKYKTKSGIKVERNRTISPTMDLPKIEGSDSRHSSISPFASKKEESVSPDALAERLASRKNVSISP